MPVVHLVPYDAEHVDLLVPWFEDAETQRWLGGPGWPRLVHDLLVAPERQPEFRGSRVLRAFGFAGVLDDEVVSYAGGDVYDREHRVSGRDDDGELVFAAASGPPRTTAGLSLAVSPQHRGHGLGAATLRALVAHPDLSDVHVWSGGVEPGNVASLRAFASAGFRLTGDAPDAEGMLTVVLDTLTTYEHTADRYAGAQAPARAEHVAVLDELAARLGPGARVLEIGSGTGDDADALERRGLTVTRTDATRSFVERVRALGHDAAVLDVTRDDLGGPWDAVFANAVLHHLTRDAFATAVTSVAGALRPGGVFAFSVKEGDGEQWHDRKVGAPRHFTYWREPALRAAVSGARWSEVRVTHVRGDEPWLFAWLRR